MAQRVLRSARARKSSATPASAKPGGKVISRIGIGASKIATLARAIKTAHASQAIGFLHHKAGHEIPVRLRAVQVRNGHGSIITRSLPRALLFSRTIMFAPSCDSLRMAIAGVDAFDLDPMLDLDLEVLHQDSTGPTPLSAAWMIPCPTWGLGRPARRPHYRITVGARGGPSEEIGSF